MQMGEASEHRPGDYGRWESSLWSPWHQGSHFFIFFLGWRRRGGLGGLVGGLEAGGRCGGEGSLSPSGEEEEEEEGGEEHVMVSFPHMRQRLTRRPPPPSK